MLAIALSVLVALPAQDAPIPLVAPPPKAAPKAVAPKANPKLPAAVKKKLDDAKKKLEDKASFTPSDPSSFAPCQPAPKGMACIPGGPAIVGNDDGPAAEKPRRTIEISTFYMDIDEVTHAQYQACVDARACPPLNIPDYNKNIMKPFMGPDQPAVPIDYERAQKFCTWAGKRLPTEWEWEKAARGPDGDLYPWGNDPPTCDKAQFRECAPKGCKPYRGKSHEWDCVEHATRPVGSYPAGHYGLHDMSGNGYEWTSTWAGSTAACTLNCDGRDPKGPCDGASPCTAGAGMKILRGGSWYWPKEQARGSYRRAEVPTTMTHRLSVRCASSSPVLWGYPAKIAVEKRPKPAAPQPPTEEQKKIAADIREDELNKQECADKGRSFIDCRDPNSYIKSNEHRQELWRPYIENLGGGYTGVGIDQNYTFIAAARSEWAWLFDYDPTVVRLHWVLRAMILHAPDRGSFVDMFRPEKKDEALQILSQEYAGNPERVAYREIYAISRAALLKYYERQLTGTKADPTFGWLADDQNYTYIRTLYQQGRIRILKGDMLAKNTMQGIGAAAKKLGVTIRVYYPSNAPECWPHTQQYKSNVNALPFDDKTVVLQTLSGTRPGFGEKKKGYWHYNVQSGLQQQELMRLKGYMSLKQLVSLRNRTDDPDLTLSGLEAAAQPR
jgi:formylglycine-generating enzyme required for sulfatase activity